MTRENKLALVVGFGLILLVGILISDHFSVARNQTAAQLGQVVDPLANEAPEAGDARADLLALRPRPRIAPPPAPALRAAAFSAEPGAVRPLPERGVISAPAIEMGRMDQPASREAGVGLDPRDAERLPYTIHVVSEGESLSSICGDRFGDPSLALELARYNEITDPDRVRIGHRLRVPSAGDLVRGRPAPVSVPAPRVAAASPATPAGQDRATERTYTVQEGDVLSEIASRLLGSSRKYLVIYEHNRDILKSPDALRAGMTLKIPRDAS